MTNTDLINRLEMALCIQINEISDNNIKSSGASWILHGACTTWATKTYMKRQRVRNNAKIKKLPFCQELIFRLHIFLCKCSMCLHCVYKVSDDNSKSYCTNWIPYACTIWATKAYMKPQRVRNNSKIKMLPFCQELILGIKLLYANDQCIYIVQAPR